METGALAMIDALGFKGIWRRPEVAGDLQKIITKLERLVATAKDDPSGGMPCSRTLKIVFLSDTIVIALTLPGEEPFTSLKLASRSISRLLVESARTSPVLAYRGAMTFGEFEIKDPFIVGPAVDEAAEAMNAPDAAIVMLTDSAAQHARLPKSSDTRPGTVLMPYAVPLKGGSVFHTFAVSPFMMNVPKEDRAGIISNICRTFLGGTEIAVKRQNTERFLNAAADWSPFSQ